ncbi:LysR family transcriptional regulator [Companilactobacillus jidongensis]|uniref:LysR family transcriptional regulator n=1 Tax=Companilactobacillus jidongensis TaxID=2486006 RepID=UPI000F7B3942|nr:LysR family transcriptional regulator [Companilactobacillus jidongensis]
MNNYDELLNYFNAILNFGSFSAASDQLFISQSYLSKVVLKAEKELGATLLNRSHHPITLTYAGEKFMSGLETIAFEKRNLYQEVHDIANNKNGHISLGINQSIASTFLPNVLPVFHDKYPNIHITLSENPSAELESQLLHQDLDFQIRMLPIYTNTIQFTHLKYEPIYLILAKNSPYFTPEKSKIDILEDKFECLKQQDFISLYSGSGFSRLLETFLNRQEINLNTVLKVKSIQTSASLAYKGLASTFVPESFLDKQFNSSLCNIYKVSPNVLKMNVVLASLKDREFTREMELFQKSVIRSFSCYN